MSINKLAYFDHFELKLESLRPSEAEFGIPILVAYPETFFSRFVRKREVIQLRVAI